MQVDQEEHLADRADIPARDGQPIHEEIAALAHRLWESRGCPLGDPDEDWFRAEAHFLANIDSYDS